MVCVKNTFSFVNVGHLIDVVENPWEDDNPLPDYVQVYTSKRPLCRRNLLKLRHGNLGIGWESYVFSHYPEFNEGRNGSFAYSEKWFMVLIQSLCPINFHI